MPKSMAPRLAPLGQKWCAKHNEGRGEFLEAAEFPNETYSYCCECKREYQRAWEKTNRPSSRKPYSPRARLSKNEKTIIVHVPNDEKGRNHIRVLLGYWEESDLSF